MPDRRIFKHPILDFKRGEKVRIYFDGEELEVFEGENLAAALYASGIDVIRFSEKMGRPRGPFCMIGKCSSCLVGVDGYVERACMLRVREGMVVERLRGLPSLPRGSESFGCFEEFETDILIIGSGPAGLSCAEVIAPSGLDVTLVDDQPRVGGQLLKQTHRFFGSRELFAGYRGFQVARLLEERVRRYSNVRFLLETTAIGVFKEGVLLASSDKLFLAKPRSVVVATGATENFLVFGNNDLPGVMGAGGAQTLMNLHGVKPGEDILVVGSGNVGLIVSYQLLQAGSRVTCIVEALPRIGGWLVHAAKVRRYGVPILTSHTVKSAWGNGRVEGATIVRLDEKWEEIKGSEKEVECDSILLAVGLTPNVELLRQFGAAMRYLPEMGGLVALRTKYLETTVPNVFVAGDVAGIEEATTAIIEGRVVGYTILTRFLGARDEYISAREKNLALLEEYRKAPSSARIRSAWPKVLVEVKTCE